MMKDVANQQMNKQNYMTTTTMRDGTFVDDSRLGCLFAPSPDLLSYSITDDEIAEHEPCSKDWGLSTHLDQGREGCYDKETEVLTKSGWKYFADATVDDEIMTLA